MNSLTSIFVLLFASLAAAATNYPIPPPLCKKLCVDMSKQCEHLKGMCGIVPAIASVCAKTCGKCELCNESETSVVGTSGCEVGTCKDQLAPILCSLYKRHSLGCIIAGNQCRASCSLCTPCKLPPTVKSCSEDCIDTHKSCGFWKNDSFCDPKNGFPDVRKVCEMSCGRCKPCPTYILPPTEEQLQNSRRL